MKAMIFAAGLGTRLRPLTDNQPKALIEINGTALLEIVIKQLIAHGYNEIIVNVHHFAERIIEYLKQKDNFGAEIAISDESKLLLDTGGGLKNARWFFNDNKPFLVHNVDVISDINLKKLYETHLRSEALATLAVRNRKTSRYLLFDDENKLCAWKNIKTNELKIARNSESKLRALAFSGIQIVNPTVFDLITEQGSFSIIDVYLRIAANHKITGFNHDESFWVDLGKKEDLAKIQLKNLGIG